MGIEVNGVTRKVTSDDGEISVKAGSLHQFFLHPDSSGDMTVYLSAPDAGMDFQLDRILRTGTDIGMMRFCTSEG